MKKIIVSTFLLASLVACYKDDAILEEIVQEPLTKSKDYLSGDERVKMKRHKITPERAMLIAEDAKDFFADERAQVKTRSATVPLLPVAITSHPKTRSAGGADTLMYVVNFSNNGGYVFVSNDDRDGEILMYSGGGSFQMQDTTDNPGLKLHVELMLGYQKHKLSEMRAAEARGEEYMGSMTTEEVSIDECLPNIAAATTKASGMPGMPGGLPGHTCNVTGQPGMPGLPGSTPTRNDICAPATYISKDWFGDIDAIELAQKKYRNQKCFGVPVNPPTINFMTTDGDHGFLGPEGEAPPCESAPYCTPPLWNYAEYYNFYGAKMSMHYKTVRDIEVIQTRPLLTTYWEQEAPLMHGSNKAGCGPIALAQLMVYHNQPKTYGSKAFGGVHRTEIDELRKLKTNTDIANSYYCYAAQNFLEEIRVRLGVDYNSDGSTSTSIDFRLKKIREAFESFGFIIGYNNGAGHHGVWDYFRDYSFPKVVESINSRHPVFMSGTRPGGGHFWLLDGYKKIVIRYYFADYYFDEYGKFNAENRYNTQTTQQEYVHANMGWGINYEGWVLRGVYEFEGRNYSEAIFYMAGIRPGI